MVRVRVRVRVRARDRVRVRVRASRPALCSATAKAVVIDGSWSESSGST